MPKIINYATDSNIVEKAQVFCDIYEQVKRDRRTLEDRWLQYWDMWKVYVTAGTRYYAGTSNIFLPVLRKSTEDGINNIATKLFPTDDFINVRAMPGTPEKYADGVKVLLAFQMIEEMQLPLNIKTALREMLVNGTTVSKIGFDGRKHCPYINPLSLMEDFYLYPTTVSDVDDAMVTFERMRVDKYELEYLASKGKYVNIDQLRDEGSIESDKEREEKQINKVHDQYKELPIYDLVETYGVMDIKGEQENVIVTFDAQEKKIIQITPSPYKYKTASKEYYYFKPYVAHSLIRLPKSFYGNSIYEIGQRLQYALNDSANLTLDNGILQQTPIVKADRARVGNMASLVFKPRAIWDCEPDAVIMDRPPDVLASGLGMVSQLKFWLEENSNIGGLTPMTNKRTTATEMSIYSQLMGTFISSTVADIESGLTLPLAKKIFYLDQIYLENKDVKRILGLNAKYIQLGKEGNKIVQKDYMFRWLGSTQSMNIHIKSQQAINYIGMTSAIPPQALGGAQINYPYLLKEAWRNLGHSDVDKVVIEADKQAEVEAREENEILLNGKEVTIHIKDDDMTHMLAHDIASKQVTDEAIFTMITLHTREHMAQAQAKEKMKQQMAMQQQMAMMGMQPPGQGGQPQGKPSTPNQAPRTTQANTVGDVMATNMGGDATRPYVRPNSQGEMNG